MTTGHEKTSGSEEHVHHLDCSDGFMSVCISRHVQFIVHESCLNKVVKKWKEEKMERL